MTRYIYIDWDNQLLRTHLAEIYGVELANKLLPIDDKYIYKLNISTLLNDEELKKNGLYTDKEYISKAKLPEIPETLKSNENIMISLTPDASNIIQAEDMKELFKLFYLNNSPEKSNAWAIHGNHTVSGFPLVSSDPHLNTKIPSNWHLASLQIQEKATKKILHEGKGIAMPGVPGLMGGANRYMAFGNTALLSEDTEAFKMILDKEKKHYFYNNSWVRLHERTEVISVKGEKDIEYIVKSSHHGPILFDIPSINGIIAFGSPINSQHIISLAWCGNVHNDPTLQLVMESFLVENKEKFETMTKSRIQITAAMVWGSKDNNIGLNGVGFVQGKAHPRDRIFLLEGWNPEHDWGKWLEVEKNTKLINPSKGFIVSCNNRVYIYIYFLAFIREFIEWGWDNNSPHRKSTEGNRDY